MSTKQSRHFRRTMSRGEARLWLRLKALHGGDGLHFRRQREFRGYYLDFVCFSRRLVIEVDGSQHSEDAQISHDFTRDIVLRREGFEVMRIRHGHILRDIDAVMLGVHDMLAGRPYFAPVGRRGPKTPPSVSSLRSEPPSP